MGPLTSVNFVAAALVGTYGSSVDAGHADFYRMFLYNDFYGNYHVSKNKDNLTHFL